MKRTFIALGIAGIGMVPGLALADTASVQVDADHTATIASAAPGASTRDLLTPEEILALVAKSKPASVSPAQTSRDVPAYEPK